MNSKNLASFKNKDIDDFRNRLHVNTILSVVVNTLAVYLILKHSASVMGIYKYYILSTVFFAFLMDFHLTFIFGMFPLFPECAMCPAGIARYFGPHWGNTVQFSLFHFTLSFCGLSLVFASLYQYLSLINKVEFLQTKTGFFVVVFTMLLYPLPSFYQFISNVNYEKYLEYIEKTDPEVLPFFISSSCNGYVFTKAIGIYLLVATFQVVTIVILMAILQTKIIQLFSKLKHSMSDSTLKMRKQLFIVLAIQMAAPFFIMILPLVLIVVLISLDIRNNMINQICVQILSFHSIANALIIIFVIKSYRQTIFRWLRKCIRKSIKIKTELLTNHANRRVFNIANKIVESSNIFSTNATLDYTIQDIKSFGARLHVNTLLAIIFNSLAAYLIIKHSMRSIAKYKYYILSTVFFAFLMDFHLTFIYDIFPLFPICATCPSGIAKHFGPFWGVTVQFGALHFTLSFCGLSVFAGLVYQYLTIVKKTRFLQTRKGGIVVGILILLYPLPSFILHILNVDYIAMLKHINETEPNLYLFFVEASCNGQAFTKLTVAYLCVAFSQIFLIHFIAMALGFRIFKTLLEMKYKMSFTTLKMRQQFFIVLAIQMAIPGLFIMIPLLLLVSMILFNVKNFEVLSQAFIQTLTLHSVANSLTIMIFIKSYRQVLQKWYTNVSTFICRRQRHQN